MARTIVDLSREISHMMPVANPHINQVPAFWDRLTHASTKGTMGERHQLPHPGFPDRRTRRHPCGRALPLRSAPERAMSGQAAARHVPDRRRVHRRIPRRAGGIHRRRRSQERTGKGRPVDQEGRHLPLLAELLRAQGRAQLAARVRRPRLGRGAVAGGPGRRQHRLRMRQHRQLRGHARSTRSPPSLRTARAAIAASSTRKTSPISTRWWASASSTSACRCRLVGGTGCPFGQSAMLDA